MLLASNRGAGGNFGMPDVCLIPAVPAPIPTPFPNFALFAMALEFAITVFVSFVNALNLASEIPMTSGDEGGAASPIKGPGRFTMGNPIVMVEGLPAINLLCPTTGNNMINALGAVLIPSLTCVFYCHAGAALPGGAGGEGRAEPAGLDAVGLARLAEALGSGLGGAEGEALLPGGVAFLAIPCFSSGVPARVYSAVRRFEAQGLTAMILDLRGNPGGELLSAVELLGDFVDEGTLLLTAIDADGDETAYRSHQPRPYRFPLVLLVDARTASAAELFAGSLQALGRAVVVGETTRGKGSAQALLPGLGRPGAHYVTVGSFALPGGASIEGRGVRPDLALGLDAGAVEATEATAASLTEPADSRTVAHGI